MQERYVIYRGVRRRRVVYVGRIKVVWAELGERQTGLIVGLHEQAAIAHRS